MVTYRKAGSQKTETGSAIPSIIGGLLIPTAQSLLIPVV